MAVSETAKLIVDLSLKGNFARQMGANQKALDRFTKGEGRAFKAGAQIGTGIKNAAKVAAVGIGVLASQVALGLDSLIQLEKAEAQTAAVLKSTGQAARINAKEVTRLAEKYEALNAIVGDEFIRAGENMLLTFTNIRGKAFEPALQAILDINTAMGNGPEGLTNTAIQVGKALNDPVKGVTALTRVGVTFTKKQVDKIKSLQKEGKLYEAQKIVLAELNKEFGGSFAAQGGTTAAKVAKFTDAVDDLHRSLATALLPTVSNVADALSEFLADPAVVRGAEQLGEEIGKMFSKENIQSGITALRGIFNTAREVAPIVAAAAKTMGGFISSAVKAFQSLPPEIQNLAIAGFAVNKLTGGLVTNIGGGLLSAVLRQLKTAVVTVHGGVVNVSGPAGLGGAAGPGGVKALAAVLGPAIAVALGSQFVTDEANKGLGTTFKNPFAGGIGGGIITALENLAKIVNSKTGAAGGGFGPANSTKPAGSDTFRSDAPEKRDWRHADAVRIATGIEKMHAAIGRDLSQKPVIQAHKDSANKQYNAIERLRTDIGADLGNLVILASKGVDASLNPNLKGGGHQGLLEAAIHDQTAVLRGWAQIEDRRGAKAVEVANRTTTAVETMRAGITADLGNIQATSLDAKIIASAQARTALETKASTDAGLIATGLAAKRAGDTSASATRVSVSSAASRITSAIRANRPITNVSVHVNATTVSKTVTVVSRYGPTGGSGSTNSRYGSQPT